MAFLCKMILLIGSNPLYIRTYYRTICNRSSFWFWRFLRRGLIWHFSQASIRPWFYLSLIDKSPSNPFLEPTSTKQWGESFVLTETTWGFDVLCYLCKRCRYCICNFCFYIWLNLLVVYNNWIKGDYDVWPFVSNYLTF